MIDIHYNRKTSISAYEKRYLHGWKYMQPKTLDLTPDDGYTILQCHSKPVTIIHKVDLTEELPKDVRARRYGQAASGTQDYDIMGMYKWLEKNAEPQTWKDRKQFNYPEPVRK